MYSADNQRLPREGIAAIAGQRRKKVVAGDPRVFASQSLSARPFTGGDRLNKGAMLRLRDKERPFGPRVRQHKGRGRGKGQRRNPLKLAAQHVGAREPRKRAVEFRIQLGICGKIDRAIGKTAVEPGKEPLKRGKILRFCSALGGKPGGGAFMHAAQVDGVKHIRAAEGAHHEAPAARALEKAFARAGGRG